MIVLRLPLPPSVNSYQRNARVAVGWNIKNGKVVKTARGRRYTTREANQWKQDAGWEINKQLGAHRPLTGDLCMTVTMQRRGDIDNRVKPLADLLQEHRIFENDRQIVRLIVSFADIEGCEVQITQAQRL